MLYFCRLNDDVPEKRDIEPKKIYNELKNIEEMRKLIIIALILLPMLASAQNSSDHNYRVAKNLEVFNAVYRNLDLLYVDSLNADEVVGDAVNQSRRNTARAGALHRGRAAVVERLCQLPAQIAGRAAREAVEEGTPAQRQQLARGEAGGEQRHPGQLGAQSTAFPQARQRAGRLSAASASHRARPVLQRADCSGGQCLLCQVSRGRNPERDDSFHRPGRTGGRARSAWRFAASPENRRSRRASRISLRSQ